MKVGIPDFAGVCRELQESGFPLMGQLVAPSVRTAANGGFVHRDVVKTEAQRFGIPEDYLKGMRSAPDAFRKAIRTCAGAKDFKEKYLLYDKFQGPERTVTFLVMRESDRDTAAMEAQAKSFMALYLDMDDEELYVNSAKNLSADVYQFTTNFSRNVKALYTQYRDNLNAEDVSQLLVRLLHKHTNSIAIRDNGGLYFAPRTDPGYPINPKLDQVKNFIMALSQGNIGVEWWEWAQPDYESVREQIKGAAETTMQTRNTEIRSDVKAMLQKLSEGRKVRAGSVETQLNLLTDLKDQAALYATIFGARLTELESEIAAAEKDIRSLALNGQVATASI